MLCTISELMYNQILLRILGIWADFHAKPFKVVNFSCQFPTTSIDISVHNFEHRKFKQGIWEIAREIVIL